MGACEYSVAFVRNFVIGDANDIDLTPVEEKDFTLQGFYSINELSDNSP